ncbi:ArsC/Spx/MgsR family protein [Thalassospira profundimaris]|uniref:ArsC family transcriptional regulator n=1 Tax=Thalassospira profundimaris TaxID=502049 RepID=A0A367WZ49_9PROT|nr:ArsC/Spx/MgsR family protein [Thalassospira profundimaris]RCK46716.1 ArsC family transcriptional regulator [Thalassospira profundimaris]
MVTIYGIKNCDTVRKALKWFDAKGVENKLHDFRTDGIDAKTIEGWLDEVGGTVLINKRGPSYRNLTDADKATLEQGGAAAAAILAANPTVIKRPVVDFGTTRTVAYDEKRWAELAGL